MYVIVNTEEGMSIELIGPFSSREEAEQYAKANRYWGCTLCVYVKPPKEKP